ncbi:unnamed protein product [Rhizoctonia solani]|uniref:NADP-dependent oxidoreductase domain-containing protein n=1 Tax=Rhizoctonia solani TaxID=456999 RepID=A0A8H3DTS3_9AGAM|nr:unnamed protein product [Rhizoctonia solani]
MPYAGDVWSRLDSMVSTRERVLDAPAGFVLKDDRRCLIRAKRSVEALANKKNLTMAQVALAWIMSKQVSAPVVGTTNLNLEELVAAVNIKLDEENTKYLEESYAPQAIFEHS